MVIQFLPFSLHFSNSYRISPLSPTRFSAAQHHEQCSDLRCCCCCCFLVLLLFDSTVFNFFVQPVQEKQQVTDSMGTPTKKQKFIFYDSEGSKVEGIIFNTDIPRMSPMLQVYKRYKISNADVRTIPPKFRSAGLIKQWVITSKTVIEEVDANEDIMPVKFAFTDFADLAEYMDDRTKSVDVLGVVISSLAMKTITRNSKQSNVQKFVILNEESQTVLLSLWDDFLNNEGQALLNNMQSYPVIIGRRLRVNNYNGVSLSTWFDSALLVDPPIQEARQLKNWAMRNAESIAEIVDAKSYIKYNPALSLKRDQKTTLICNVTPSHKTAWVKANLSFEHIFQKYWYMSCAKCYRATAADYGIEFTCNSCKEKGPAMPRCRFDIELSDDSGAIPASIFGDLAENILTFTGLEAMDNFNQLLCFFQNLELPLEFVHAQLKTKTYLVHIKPVQTQLADARQRYTVLYCSELEPKIARPQLTHEPESVSLSADQQTENEQLLTPEHGSSSSKVRLRLSEKFDETDTVSTNDFDSPDADSKKKAKLV
ncbi:replication protein A 70 kDa DNA-binding subunit B-like isoform X3 [Coffea arabica]|uniref:Replication protein A 70 kDa DNA-binding subunit B-like isoform X3 n=1 Tax=Coffea arabica TaxID=13443 RepID=A0ABM4V360_COFAR